VNIYNRVRADGTVSIDVRKLGRTEPAPQDEEEEAWDDSQSVHHTMHFSAFAPKRERRNDDR
jgi:hypothetical protein